jgi:Domain of unknown function (DUF397)
MEDWRKSSYSGANGGSCVETASGAGVILVRDTTDRDGFTLSVPAETWAKFTATIKLPRRADEGGSDLARPPTPGEAANLLRRQRLDTA